MHIFSTSGNLMATDLPDIAITSFRQSKWQSVAGKVLVVITGNLSGKLLPANYRSAYFLPATHTDFAGKTPFCHSHFAWQSPWQQLATTEKHWQSTVKIGGDNL